MSTSGKIRIKVGNIEIDYEGTEAFIREELPILIQSVAELAGPITLDTEASTAPPLLPAPIETPPSQPSGSAPALAPNSVAAKLSVKTGSDLALAAAAAIQLGSSGEPFARADLLKTMRSAHHYFKANMAGNLSKILATLVKDGRINEISGDRYTLSAGELARMKTAIA